MTSKGWKYFTAKDYVVYSPDFTAVDFAPDTAYILSRDDFFDALEACGLIREKRSSAAVKNGLPADRLAIQSFKNSKKKYLEWLNALADRALEWNEWIDELGL